MKDREDHIAICVLAAAMLLIAGAWIIIALQP